MMLAFWCCCSAVAAPGPIVVVASSDTLETAAVAVVASSDTPETAAVAVVASSDSPETAAVVEAVARQRAAAGDSVEPQASLAARLMGTSTPRDPDEATLRRMLDDARDREARFDTPGANAVREQILRAFDSAVRPGTAVRAIAGEAGLDMAAALLLEGDRKGAVRVAAEVWRRFGSAPINTNRHPPSAVRFLQAQREAVASRVQCELTIVSDRAGIVFADGTRLGKTQGRLDAGLPAGSYRVWLEWDGGMSLPHPVNVGASQAQVTIDTEAEQRLSVVDGVVLVRCDEECPARLAALGKRLGVARVLAVAGPTTDSAPAGQRRFRVLDVQVDTSEASESFVGADGQPAVDAGFGLLPEHRPVFSPLYLVPFGVGQLVQDRPLFAAGYLGIQVGLFGWYAWVRRSGLRAGETGDLARERELQERRDVLLGLFVGAVAAGVIEAVVVGLATGE